MKKTDWRSTLRFAAVLLVIAMVTAAVFYGDEIGRWLADAFFAGTQSQIEQILK